MLNGVSVGICALPPRLNDRGALARSLGAVLDEPAPDVAGLAICFPEGRFLTATPSFFARERAKRRPHLNKDHQTIFS